MLNNISWPSITNVKKLQCRFFFIKQCSWVDERLQKDNHRQHDGSMLVKVYQFCQVVVLLSYCKAVALFLPLLQSSNIQPQQVHFPLCSQYLEFTNRIQSVTTYMLEIKERLLSSITWLFTVKQGMTRTVMKWQTSSVISQGTLAIGFLFLWGGWGNTAGLNSISIQCRENRLHV